ncbi:MAG: VWA domain-containing protein [Pseudomonadota bacterium]|nr:VWA domain-containing protein [Pseudomonadota bacterium]
MQLAQPLLLFLLPLPLLWAALAWRRGALGEAGAWLLRHPHLAAGGQAAPPSPRAPLLLQSLAFLLLIVALAQPRQVGDWITPPQGRDIALIVDTSLTMSIDDFELAGRKTSRLAVLKSVLERFVTARPHDRIGLLVFGAQAATLTPPTFDHAHVLAQIERLQVGMAGENTALGDALGLALKEVRQGRLRPAIVLVSDGEASNTGDLTPAEAVAVARQTGVAIHTLQVGSDLFAAGREAQAPTDAQPALAEIARLTGGQHGFVRTAEDAESVIRAIDRLEKTLARPARQREIREWYGLPLALAAAGLLLARVLSIRRQGA